jgi:hypothetical protein
VVLSGQKLGASTERFRELGFDVDPGSWLKEPKIEDSKSIRGVSTTHVKADLDVRRIVADVGKVQSRALAQLEREVRGPIDGEANSQLGRLSPQAFDRVRQVLEPGFEQLERRVGDLVPKATFDLYAGKADSVMRKLQVDIEFKREQNTAITGRISLAMELFDVGAPQTVQLPRSARPFAARKRKIRDEIGAYTDGSSSGATGGSAGKTARFAQSDVSYRFEYPRAWGSASHRDGAEVSPLLEQTTIAGDGSVIVATSQRAPAGQSVPERISHSESTVRRSTARDGGKLAAIKQVEPNGVPGIEIDQRFPDGRRVLSAFLFSNRFDYTIGCMWPTRGAGLLRLCRQVLASFTIRR